MNSDGFCHSPTSGEVIHGDGVEFWLYLMEWEREDDDALVGKLKQIMAGFRRDLGNDLRKFRTQLTGAIRDESIKYQVLPYFERTTWLPANMLEILNRNTTTKRKYRPDLLPTTERPERPFDETISNKDSFDAYTIDSFERDPPIYEFATYVYEKGETTVLSRGDFLRFMSFCYGKLRLGQYMAGDRTFADIDAEQLRLRLINGKRHDAFISEGDPRPAL